MNADQNAKSKRNLPRILVAAPGSGSGKTIFTCAFIRALQRRGDDPAAFKCGPDYIDPMFHKKVLGAESENLDLFFAGKEGVNTILSECTGKCAVIEGVMGIYDGLSVKDDAGSCYEIASVTKTPIVLVVNAKGSGRSLISQIVGILNDDKERLIKAIVLNQMSANFYEGFKAELEDRINLEGYDVAVVGYIPHNKDVVFESRHLGLKMPGEIDDINARIDRLCDIINESVDTDNLVDIMQKARPVESSAAGTTDTLAKNETGLTLAVAYDEAFCFYYRDNLRQFEKQGVNIKFFSPITDEAIPVEADAVLLGGGYPELYLKELSENDKMRSSVLNAIQSGMPSLAECGGFMYLHDVIKDKDGNDHPMAGAVRGECSYVGHLVRFGYLISDKGLKGHEFHYFESTDPGSDMVVTKPDGSRERKAMHVCDNSFWGFPHFYYASMPQFVDDFILKMRDYHDKKQS